MKRAFWKILGLALLLVALQKTVLPELWADDTPATQSQTTAVDGPHAQDRDAASNQDADDYWFRGGPHRHGGFPFLVPVAFFGFLLIIIVSKQYFRAKTELSRIALLNSMVEKGQPIPEGWINRDRYESRWGRRHQPHSLLRRGIIFTLIGIAFIAIRYLENRHGGFLPVGIVFLAIGVGNLVSLGVGGRFLESDRNKREP